MRYPQGIGDLAAFLSTDGTKVPSVQGSNGTPTGCTLGAHTYYVPIGSENAPICAEATNLGIYLAFQGAVAGTVTIEICNLPATLSGEDQGGPDLVDWDTTGLWVPFNPAASGSLYANITGAGNSLAAMTATLGGTHAGACFWNLPSMGNRRLRLAIVLTAGGVVRPNAFSKLGA